MYKLLFLFSLLILSLLSAEKACTQTQKPNIIFILGDDIGYRTLGCNGGTRFSTPNLDTLAQRGMRFTSCYSSPLCSPSRHTLLTGKYNFRNYSQWGIMNSNEKTIANVFKDAGYNTACYGKWQLNGGDSSIHAFGFNSYCIWMPYQNSSIGSRYKNPQIYQNAHTLPASITSGSYGEDIFTDSILRFIDSNKSEPFFIYYPMVLAHGPFQPTPDDSAYSAWDVTQKDTSFYKSMIAYMDKKIGLIISKVKSLGIENNTIILYAGDNGTPSSIIESIGDDDISGGKGTTTQSGTHVPLIVSSPGKIPAGIVSDNLIDFTDFLPSLASIANVSVPTGYGQLDGIDFSPTLAGQQVQGREWVFNYYDPQPGKSIPKRWVHTHNYKLVDYLGILLFYNIITDSEENNPIPDSLLTAQELVIKQQLLTVLNYYSTQGPPVLINSTASNITDSSAFIGATIEASGGLSSVTERGTLLSPVPITVLSKFFSNNPVRDSGTAVTSFAHIRSGLEPQKKYYFKGYAANSNGIGVSPEASFYTLAKEVAMPSSSLIAVPDSTSISLNWSDAAFPDSGAANAGYLLIYSNATPSVIASPNGLAPVAAIKDGRIITHASSELPALPATSAILTGLKKGTEYNFLLLPYTWDGINISTYNYFIKGSKTVSAVTLHDSCIVPAITSAVTNEKCSGANTATIAISIQGGSAPFKFTWSGPGLFNSSLRSISNLAKGSYHLTITAKGGCAVDTTYDITEPPMLNISATADSVNCNGDQTTVTVIASGGSGKDLYTLIGGTTTTGPQTSNKFVADAGKYKVIVSDSFNCKASSWVTIYEPAPLKVSVMADTIFCNDDSVTLTARASGGTGSYLYTLSDGQKTTGPQTANTFTVSDGTYIVTVQDLKNCRSADTVKVLSCLPDDAFILTVYPNPGVEDFVLTIQTKSTEKIEYFITDLMGKRLLFATGVANEKIHFGKNLPSGMYYVTAIQGAKRQVLKVLKSK